MKISILFSISKIDHQNDKWKLIINDLNQKNVIMMLMNTDKSK